MTIKTSIFYLVQTSKEIFCKKVVTLFAFLRHPNFEGIQVILLERLCRGNKRLGFKRA